MARISFQKEGKKIYTIIEWPENGEKREIKKPLGKLFADYCNLSRVMNPPDLLENVVEQYNAIENEPLLLGDFLNELVDRDYFNDMLIFEHPYFKLYYDAFMSMKAFFLKQKAGQKIHDEDIHRESLELICEDFRGKSMSSLGDEELLELFRKIVFTYICEAWETETVVNSLILWTDLTKIIEIRDITVSFSLFNSNDKFQSIESFEFRSAEQALKLEYFMMRRYDIFMKSCKNCHKYFLYGIEQKNAHKEYCDDIQCKRARENRRYEGKKELRRAQIYYNREKDEAKKVILGKQIIELKVERLEGKRGRKKITKF
jgi:hypothetical protein